MQKLLYTLEFNAIITSDCISLIGCFMYCLEIRRGENDKNRGVASLSRVF